MARRGPGRRSQTNNSSGAAGNVRTHIEWDFSEIEHNLDIMPEFLERATLAALARQAGPMTNFARSNAPWNDQTGNARSGLSSKHGQEGSTLFLEISHGVSYGIWLEVRWGGRYGILEKTLEYSGPRVMKTLEGILDRFPGGA